MSNVTISVGGTLEKLKDLSGGLPSGPPFFPKEAWENAVEVLITAAESTPTFNDNVKVIDLQISIPIPDAEPKPTSSTPTQGGDPVKPLEEIAKAIGSAENILNNDNLVISQASVEVNMSVSVPGIAGADTTIKFGVEPRSM